MNIQDAISLLKTYSGPDVLTLHPGVDEATLDQIEATYGITLPDDFKVLYRFSDGFEMDEDMFNLMTVSEILACHQPGENMQIAEYMINSDCWYLWIDPLDHNNYEVTYAIHDNALILTRSLGEFIARVLGGGVFGNGGLYEWHQEVEAQPIYTTKLSVAQPVLTVFYYGLRYDLLSKQEVIAWVDRIVAHEDEPENLFIEMSVAHDKNALISLLEPVHRPDIAAATRGLLALLYRLLSAKMISVKRAIAVMNEHHFSGILTEAENGHIKLYTYQLPPEDEEPNEQFNSKVLNFLSNYKQFTFDSFKDWLGADITMAYKWRQKTETKTVHYTDKYPCNHNVPQIKRTTDSFLDVMLTATLLICIAVTYHFAERVNALGSADPDYLFYKFGLLGTSAFTIFTLITSLRRLFGTS